MKRVLTRDLKDNLGDVLVEGWLHKKRKMGGLNFILVRDRAGIAQLLVKDEQEMEKLRGLQIGTVLRIKGKAEADERAPGGVEIHDPEIEVMVAVEEEPPIEIDKPLSHDPDNLDTLFEYRAIGLRNIQERTVFELRSHINHYIREFLRNNDFIEMQTPKLLPGATEGGAELFKLDYFGQEATLAQSPQFYKQIMVGVFERVFEIAPAYRAELSNTRRHMTELTMLDIELGFIKDHDDVLRMTEKLLYEVLTKLYKEHPDQLQAVRAPELKLKKSFPRYTVEEVHRLFSDANDENTTGEKDLSPAEERWICNYALKQEGCEAVFVTDLPIEAMKFYHMANEDGKTARSADLLFRGLELATAPQREHRYERIIQQIKDAGIDPEHPGFKYYLSAFKYGLPPHGGFGFGIDRLTQTTLGLGNVKEATLFPRDLNRLAP